MEGSGSPPARERTIDVLCEAFADDRIGLDEFERRVALAHAASSEDELRSLLTDLPRPGRVAPRKGGSSRDRDASSRDRDVPSRDRDAPSAPSAPAPPSTRRQASLETVADQNVVVGFLGGGGRRGAWTAARTNWAIAVMGGVELDLGHAVLAPGVTEVKVLAFWGGVEIVVPPDVRVECSGVGILGGFEHDQTAPSTNDPDAPILRVSGWAVMGGIEVTVRYPGESKKEARRRLRSGGGT